MNSRDCLRNKRQRQGSLCNMCIPAVTTEDAVLHCDIENSAAHLAAHCA